MQDKSCTQASADHVLHCCMLLPVPTVSISCNATDASEHNSAFGP